MLYMQFTTPVLTLAPSVDDVKRQYILSLIAYLMTW